MGQIAGADLRKPAVKTFLPDGVVFVSLPAVASDEDEFIDFEEDGEGFVTKLLACCTEGEDLFVTTGSGDLGFAS